MGRPGWQGVKPRPLGRSGLFVSPVGLGAGRIGGPDVSDEDVDRLLGAALDTGVTLIDTARSYGASEERLGRALAGRRAGLILSTKVGYGVPGIPDWTGACVTAGVDAALARLATGWIDVIHLHSCPVEVLERGEVVEPLVRAVEAGKVRVAAYSGEGEALEWAVRSGAFGAVQCSVSLVDQGSLDGPIAEGSARGIGVLGKRALGNAPWRFPDRPPEPDVAEAWDRFAALGLPCPSGGWTAFSIRFAAHRPGVSAVLVGTASPAHLAEAVDAVRQGPLSVKDVEVARAAFERAGRGWSGRV
jgi:aryl-alcohol dehydrogenase-like predicted oxidoreductase